MKKKFIAIGVLVLIIGGCDDEPVNKTANTFSAPAMTDIKFNTSLPLNIVMEHVITPAAFGVWSAGGVIINSTGEHSLAPKTEDDWEIIVNYAATLLESSNALLLPGRIRDEAWPQQVAALANIAQQAIVAAEARDAQAINEVGNALVEVCGGCHKKYNLPEEY